MREHHYCISGWVRREHACGLARGCAVVDSNSSAAVVDVFKTRVLACRGVSMSWGFSETDFASTYLPSCLGLEIFPLLLLYQHCILAHR